MKPRTVLIYLTILVLAGGYYLYFEVYKTKQSQADKELAATVFPFSKQALTWLAIDRGEHIELSRRGDNWMITAPVKENVDRRALAELIDALAGLKSQRELKDFTDKNVFAKPLTISFHASGKSYSLTLGSQTPTKEFRYARASTRRGIFLVRDADATGLDKDLLALRDKRLFTLPVEQVDTFSLAGQGFSLQALKDKDGRWHMPGKDTPLNHAKVENLLRQIWWQEATLFADGMTIGTQPLWEITLGSAQTSQSLKVWQVGKALFAKSTLHPQFLEIDRMFLESLPKDVGTLITKGGPA
jgi:hypothetical protein